MFLDFESRFLYFPVEGGNESYFGVPIGLWRSSMKSSFLSVLAAGLMLGAGAGNADEQADVKALLDKAIKAMGGQAKLAKLGAAAVKAKLTGSPDGKDIILDLDGIWQGMSQYRIDADVQEGGNNFKVLLVFNSDKGWIKRDNNNPKDVPEGALPFIQNIFYAGRMPQLLPALSDQPYQLALLGEVMVGTQAAMGLSISHNDRKDVRLFFDKNTGLPIKSEVIVSEPKTNKEITVDVRYSDYKDFDGLKLCATVMATLDNREFKLELSEIKGVDKVDDSRFDRP
jgi:hypothetical protein